MYCVALVMGKLYNQHGAVVHIDVYLLFLVLLLL